jgi:hypothetical protein
MKSYVTAALLTLVSSQALAQALPPAAVPALDDVGLVGLIAVIGLIGGLISRRRKR